MNQTELNAFLQGLKTQLQKASGEIVAKINALEGQIANGGPVTQEVQDTVNELKTIAQALDNIVPDAPVVDQPAIPTPPDETNPAIGESTVQQ